jgi:VIT1/CCC1 family predicted Fe2+/Mn2+ transporter
VCIIAIFNYYYAVVRGESFRKRFTEMAVISFSIATISFLMGYLLKLFTGIDI